MLSALPLVLLAVVAGATGTWSPCGFSMVETLAGARGRARGALAASCGAFAIGALAGGVITFGGLALAGSALHTGGRTAIAVVVALAAAVGEVRGVRIVPQIRRQVPEPWRRTMPLPLAAGLYGVLLGLGFTTFVLTWAVWALAGISLALGRPEVGLAMGIAFGAGRALPVLALAPALERPGAHRAWVAMAERPALLRVARRADALALALVALTLVLGGAAARAATTTISAGATDPSYGGGDLAWQIPGGDGELLRAGTRQPTLGGAPALSNRWLAVLRSGGIELRDRLTGAVVAELPVTAANALAVSDDWIAWRATDQRDVDRIWAQQIGASFAPIVVAQAVPPISLGRPALDGALLVFGRSSPRTSTILADPLPAGPLTAVRHARGQGLVVSPSVLDGWLLYERDGRCGQELRLGRIAPPIVRERTLLRRGPLGTRDAGYQRGYSQQGSRPARCRHPVARSPVMLWTTALAPDAAYVTLIRPRGAKRPRSEIISVPR